MRGWHYILLAAAICIIGIGAFLYFRGFPSALHVDLNWRDWLPQSAPSPAETTSLDTKNLPSATALSQLPPRPSFTPMPPPASGLCYLTMPVKVPIRYGWITYQQGTMLRYLGQQGARFVVERGPDQFTVSPDMVTDTLAAALSLSPL